MTYKVIFDEGTARLKAANIPDYKEDARYLLEFVTGFTQATYFLHSNEEVAPEIVKQFFNLIEKRCTRIPLSYITKNREFMGFSFFVNKAVLIPEPETEILVEEVIKYSNGKDILDICTGSGCIAISLALMGMPNKVSASDISGSALTVARENAKRLLKDKGIDFIKSNLFENITGKFDIIVSNPPYIREKVINTLMPEVRDYTPRLALDGGSDGLKFYKEITEKAPSYLRENGLIFYEIGYDQGEAVSNILKENGFTEVELIKDYSKLDRIVKGKLI